jgi:hypothetical protein
MLFRATLEFGTKTGIRRKTLPKLRPTRRLLAEPERGRGKAQVVDRPGQLAWMMAPSSGSEFILYYSQLATQLGPTGRPTDKFGAIPYLGMMKFRRHINSVL